MHCVYQSQKPVAPKFINGNWVIPWFLNNTGHGIRIEGAGRMIQKAIDVMQPVMRNIYFTKASCEENALMVFQFTSNTNRNMEKKFTVNNVALAENKDGVARVWLNNRFRYDQCNTEHGAMVRMNIAHQIGHCVGIDHEEHLSVGSHCKDSIMCNNTTRSHLYITPFMLDQVEAFYEEWWKSNKPEEKLDHLMTAVQKWFIRRKVHTRDCPRYVIDAVYEILELPDIYLKDNFTVSKANAGSAKVKVLTDLFKELEGRGIRKIDFK